MMRVMAKLDGIVSKKYHCSMRNSSCPCDTLTCSKLLNGHEREADEREGFTQNLLFVLRGRGKLLPVTLGLCPAYHRPKQTVLPDAERVSL